MWRCAAIVEHVSELFPFPPLCVRLLQVFTRTDSFYLKLFHVQMFAFLVRILFFPYHMHLLLQRGFTSGLCGACVRVCYHTPHYGPYRCFSCSSTRPVMGQDEWTARRCV